MGEQISSIKDIKKKNNKIDLYYYKKEQFKKIEKFKLSWILMRVRVLRLDAYKK